MYQKVFPADLDSLYDMLDYVKAYGDQHHIPAVVSEQIRLAAEEVLVNIISYGYPGSRKGSIDITCSSTPAHKGISLTIKDEGVPFNPVEKAAIKSTAALHVLEEKSMSLGGYGICIFIGLMDRVEYERLPSGNKLVLTKYIDEEPR